MRLAKKAMWYRGGSALERGRDLCEAVGYFRGRLDRIVPRWAEAVGRISSFVNRPRISTLRAAAVLFVADPEAARAFETCFALAGSRAAAKHLIGLVHPELDEVQEAERREAARWRAQVRRETHARAKLAEHERKLAREQGLVKKWAARLRRIQTRRPTQVRGGPT